jgi:hypothetical protein
MDTSNIKISYETLWKFIIRPPRDDYDEDYLGNEIFHYNNKNYQRKDYDLISSEGYIMKCSFIEPLEEDRPSIEMPVVIYLHGNSSSRLEGLKNLDVLLKHDINLFVLDFPGCGLSEGEYISLGYHEKDDVKIVVDFLDNMPGVGKIGLWGRSMGAATTLLYTYKDPRIRAICVDSPFEKFKKLAEELVQKQINLPLFLIDGALKIVQGTVKKKNGLDIYQLKPIDHVANTFQPAIFIHAINDELINVEHSINLFNNYGGPKSLKCCDKGGHNTKRPKIIKNEIGEFFHKYLCTNAFETEQNESNKIHDYKIKTNKDNNIINDKNDYENVSNEEEEEEDEDLNNIYEEDYIVNKIIQSQNGGNDKEKNIIKIEKGKNKDKDKERAEKIMKEEKLQMEQMKETFMKLSLKKNKIQNDKDEFNINNDNYNDYEECKNNEEDNEEEYKNNSNYQGNIENGGKY